MSRTDGDTTAVAEGKIMKKDNLLKLLGLQQQENKFTFNDTKYTFQDVGIKELLDKVDSLNLKLPQSTVEEFRNLDTEIVGAVKAIKESEFKGVELEPLVTEITRLQITSLLLQCKELEKSATTANNQEAVRLFGQLAKAFSKKLASVNEYMNKNIPRSATEAKSGVDSSGAPAPQSMTSDNTESGDDTGGQGSTPEKEDSTPVQGGGGYGELYRFKTYMLHKLKYLYVKNVL